MILTEKVPMMYNELNETFLREKKEKLKSNR